MSVLRGSESNPTLVANPIGKKELNKEPKRAVRKALDRQYEEWTGFMKTPVGEACARLADPRIAELEGYLDMTLSELRVKHDLNEKEADEMRAMWRGAKGVWWSLKTEGKQFLKQLEELDKDTKQGGDDGEKAPRWKKAPKSLTESS